MTAGDSDLELHPLVPVPDLLLPKTVAVTPASQASLRRARPSSRSRTFPMHPSPGKRAELGVPRRALLLLVACVFLLLPACKDHEAPEYVADQFVEAYFQRMDQQSARQFTAFGATE